MSLPAIESIRAARAAVAGRFASRPISARRFARKLAKLPAHLPISDRFERAILGGRKSGWDSQRTHMRAWFKRHKGYRVAGGIDRSAESVYSRLLSAPGIIWIAESSGVNPATVRDAVQRALDESNPRRRPAIIKRIIPWGMIEEVI